MDNNLSDTPYDNLGLDGKIEMIKENIEILTRQAADEANKYIIGNNITSRILTQKQKLELREIANKYTKYIANMKIQLKALEAEKEDKQAKEQQNKN
ncbi:MAG: hypothetical protein ACI4T8_00460 [Christensenellales bacterium]